MTYRGETWVRVAIALAICAGAGCAQVKTHPDPDQRIKALQKALDQLDRKEQAGGDAASANRTGVSR